MKKLKIDKYRDSQLSDTFTVPVVFIHILHTLLPTLALTKLDHHGLDLDKIIDAHQQNQPYQVEIAVSEKGNDKKILITLIE